VSERSSLHGLLQARRFEEAIAQSQALLAVDPDDLAATSVLGKAFRSTGNYLDALSCFERLYADDVARRPGARSRLIDISVLHWLLGNKSEATEMMYRACADVLNRTSHLTDTAGGVTQGLLLHYMSGELGASEDEKYALGYINKRVARLERILRRRERLNWPAPIGQYILGEATFDDLFLVVEGRSMEEKFERARLSNTDSRKLVQILFYGAVAEFKAGSGARAEELLQACLSFDGPLVVHELYLARELTSNLR
jgi:tetratricopeptide (TPR) repeat protein